MSTSHAASFPKTELRPREAKEIVNLGRDSKCWKILKNLKVTEELIDDICEKLHIDLVEEELEEIRDYLMNKVMEEYNEE